MHTRAQLFGSVHKMMSDVGGVCGRCTFLNSVVAEECKMCGNVLVVGRTAAEGMKMVVNFVFGCGFLLFVRICRKMVVEQSVSSTARNFVLKKTRILHCFCSV